MDKKTVFKHTSLWIILIAILIGGLTSCILEPKEPPDRGHPGCA